MEIGPSAPIYLRKEFYVADVVSGRLSYIGKFSGFVADSVSGIFSYISKLSDISILS